MRTLDTIQADIKYLLSKKENALSRIFGSDNERLEYLRAEEVKLLDEQLLESNQAYQDIACENIYILEGLPLQLKVIDVAILKKGFTKELSGHVDATGILYCRRIASFWELSNLALSYAGRIDHLGKAHFIAQNTTNSLSRRPEQYTGIITNGELVIELSAESSGMTEYAQIERMAGDIFQGENAKRNKFLSNRKKLYIMIDQKQVKL